MITRIHPRIMRDLGEQMGHIPMSNSMGIDAVGVWAIAVLRDGTIAVGGYGAKVPAVMLARIIDGHDSIDTRNVVGLP